MLLRLHPKVNCSNHNSLHLRQLFQILTNPIPNVTTSATHRCLSYSRSIANSISSTAQQQPPPSQPTKSPSAKPLKPHQYPPRPTLPDEDLHHTYLKGSGPGGQKINKTNSAVQLTHKPTGIVVKSQATRSRSQNHTIAKKILAEKVDELVKGKESRVQVIRDVKKRKKMSGEKKRRRKYKRLEDEKGEDGKEEG